ncbi:MAG: chemotaxis protein CheA [Stellaceae bacterium]
MNEFIDQFLVESRELVEQGTRDLLALEHHPEDREQLTTAFRAFHTLKGGAGIVDFGAMARALHAAEDVLAAVRSGARAITPRLVGDCLACLDQVVQWLDAIEASGEIPSDADAAADALVARFAQEETHTTSRDAAVWAPDPEVGASPSSAARLVLEAQLLLLASSDPDGAEGRTASAARVAANVLRRLGKPEPAADIERALRRARESGDPGPIVAAIASSLAEDATAAPTPSANAPALGQDTAPRTLRVAAERIDALVNLTGELTVAKNALAHLAMLSARDGNPLALPMRDNYEAINRLVVELQHAALAMRVLPLRQVFQRFPRLVREMAASLGKPCRLVTEGDDTEADKAIVEGLFEPLLHVLRNAMDHGVETPRERAEVGKPAEATILLRGRRQGEHVVVEVEDDGAGIDVAKLRQVAAERGLATAETLAASTDAETIDLIFEPGFSTATAVTRLSGRGVGMDAVRNAVARLGGRVSVESRPNIGSIIRFNLPFSLMLTQVMTVEAGGQIFGVPFDAIVETAQVERDRISPIGAARAFVHRHLTVPVIDLEETLGRGIHERRSPKATLVIVSVGGQVGALEVDRIGERTEVILKPMAGLLSGLPGIAGTTVSGNGEVLLVLDVWMLLC